MNTREWKPKCSKRAKVVWRMLFRRGSYFAECGTCGDLGPRCRCSGLRLLPARDARVIVGERADARVERRSAE